MTAPCITDGCDAPKNLPKHRCVECWQNTLSMPEQVELAARRRERTVATHGERSRIPEREWPEGRRFCAGCQSFRRLGLDVAPSASRCRPCASAAAHASRTKSTFGITPEQYDAILAAQGGVCAICGQRPVSKRLAVDHAHDTGEVRGLCCSRCNHELLGALHDSLTLAWKALRYLALPPARAVLSSPLGTCESCEVRPATTIVVMDEEEPFSICEGCEP